jgi:hypothetical protein
MYRVTCSCGKTENNSSRIVANWIYRKCKGCNSNLIVYKDNSIVFNYNYKKDRMNSKHRVNSGTVINLSTVELPELLPNVSLSDIDNKIKTDVFMGYQFCFEKDFYVESQFELDKINDTENIKT